MKDRIVLRAVKGNCNDCFFDQSAICYKTNCDVSAIYIEEIKPVCPKCNGERYIKTEKMLIDGTYYYYRCPKCNGTGKAKENDNA